MYIFENLPKAYFANNSIEWELYLSFACIQMTDVKERTN
jgi:hypothetical protein